MTRIEQPHHSIRWRRGEPSIEWGNAQSPRAPGARSSSGAQRGCVPAAAVSVLYCVTRHTPGTPSTLYTTTLPAAASWLSCVAPPSYAPTVPRGCAGVGRAHQSRDRSVPAPRTVRLVHLPAFLARLFLQYNKSSYDTHSVAARPLARRGPADDATSQRRAPRHGVGELGRAHARWARPPTDLTRSGASGRPRTNHTWAGGGSWTAWGAGAQHVPCRTAQDDRDRMVVRVAGAAQPALGRRQTRRHARRLRTRKLTTNDTLRDWSRAAKHHQHAPPDPASPHIL